MEWTPGNKLHPWTPDPLDPEGNKAPDGGPINAADRLIKMGLMRHGDVIVGGHAAWRYGGFPEFTDEEWEEIDKNMQRIADEATQELIELRQHQT